ncbi:MAG: nitroreductase family protein [Dehalococcoidales bacterium]|nr:MAG: nitroreductase family protein [Dehalococcoidales bacterium]
MLTVMEAIEKRRSIRKFKPDPVPDELINQILEAARLAPSASNRQPWRFQIIKDPEEKERVFRETTFGARHVFEAPVVIVCGSELLTFVKGHKMAPPGSEYFGADSDDWESIKEFIPDAQLNTAIAVEHMVLAGTALGLGTCYAQRLRFGQIARILGWPRHITVFTLLLVGYADEDPAPRPRLPLEDIVLKEGNIPQ